MSFIYLMTPYLSCHPEQRENWSYSKEKEQRRKGRSKMLEQYGNLEVSLDPISRCSLLPELGKCLRRAKPNGLYYQVPMKASPHTLLPDPSLHSIFPFTLRWQSPELGFRDCGQGRKASWRHVSYEGRQLRPYCGFWDLSF